MSNDSKPTRSMAVSRLAVLGGALGLLSYGAPTAAQPAPAASPNPGFPQVEIAATFAPPGESNVRSSFRLGEEVALIGTEETGDIYKSEDAGRTWRKTVDTDELWEVSDVRNFIRARDGRLYATTSEPAFVLRSADEGETWEKVAKPKASRTVGIVQLDSGEILVGLRRSENNRISIIRSDDGFQTFDWIALSDTLPRQNVTCLFDMGDGVVLAGVGYEGSGKVFRSEDAGLTWEQTADFPDARDLMNFFRAGGKTYVMASGIATLYVSGDDGQTWATATQVWDKGFLGQSATLNHDGRTYHLLAGTDQRAKTKRHVVLISDNDGQTWHEWIELGTDVSGGASNLAVIDEHTIVVGTGNHAVQGVVYTLKVR
ncbi:MAG: YCF48-related protein [Planctomycetota bacterium]